MVTLVPLPVFEPLTAKEAIADVTALHLPSNINSCIRIQPKQYDEATYQIEDSVQFKDEKAILQTKVCPVS